MIVVDRHHTAMARTDLTRPVSLMLDDGLITPETTFFDYGCGRGGDLHRLATLGYDVAGWDPAYRPDGELRPADIVNLGYVINVIEDPSERAHALARAWVLTRRILVVAACPDWEIRSVSGQPYGDGFLTAKGTFQQFYAQAELRAWNDEMLGVRSITAAPASSLSSVNKCEHKPSSPPGCEDDPSLDHECRPRGVRAGGNCSTRRAGNPSPNPGVH